MHKLAESRPMHQPDDALKVHCNSITVYLTILTFANPAANIQCSGSLIIVSAEHIGGCETKLRCWNVCMHLELFVSVVRCGS